MKDTWFGVGFLIFFLILDGFVGFWVCGFFHKNVNTNFINCCFKSIGWKFTCPLLLQAQIVSCQTTHLQRVLQNCFSGQITLCGLLCLQNEKIIFDSIGKSVTGMMNSPQQWSDVNQLLEGGRAVNFRKCKVKWNQTINLYLCNDLNWLIDKRLYL